jgi:hypothetical protein
MDSGRLQWIPMDSGRLQWIPMDSGRLQWIPMDSQWTPADSMESNGFHQNPTESSSEVCWSPLDRVWSDSRDSAGIRQNPLDSGGLNMDWTCQFGPCHTNKFQKLSPADSSGISRIPPESVRTGGGVYSPPPRLVGIEVSQEGVIILEMSERKCSVSSADKIDPLAKA